MHFMKGVAIGALLGVSSIVSAQIVGGRVGVGAGVGVPPVGSTIDRTARATGEAVDRTATTADNTVDATTRAAPSVTVKAGVSTRVDRGTRCYYQPDDGYYDPVYRDGYYYCEQRSSGAAAGTTVTTAPR